MEGALKVEEVEVEVVDYRTFERDLGVVPADRELIEVCSLQVDPDHLVGLLMDSEHHLVFR